MITHRLNANLFPSVHLSPWLSLVLAVPVLLLGRWTARRIPLLAWYNIPHPVIGGLLISVGLLLLNLFGSFGSTVQFQTKVSAPWWTWIVSTEPEWLAGAPKTVHLPFMVCFFTCIGLNASWRLARTAGRPALVFLLLTVFLAVFQNLIGAGMARLLGVDPLLGLMCGSATLVGGHGTALGFAGEFEKAGLSGAMVIGAAAATFGMVAGSLVGGPVGAGLVRRNRLHPMASPATHLESGASGQSGFIQDIRALFGSVTLENESARVARRRSVFHLLLILACVKAGAWVSYFLQRSGITFPVYMGALITGVAVRNVVDLFRPERIDTETVDTFGSVMLAIFISMTMMTLNLKELAGTALPMLAVLAAQVAFMAVFAWFLTFRAMGSDYEAAVMAAGQCGFALGATSNAVATMKALVESFGPAPRAFLLVPVVGSFLIDLLNALNITLFLNVFR